MSIQLIETANINIKDERLATDEEKQDFILTELATTFSEDHDFLRKINKLTFGLISK